MKNESSLWASSGEIRLKRASGANFGLPSTLA
jgi:hypothetical protein